MLDAMAFQTMRPSAAGAHFAAMSLGTQLVFVQRFLRRPSVVGSVLPSSSFLADALTRPFAQRGQPAHLLEVGAGTGAVTRRLTQLLGPDDRLDVCEIDDSLADRLECDLLSRDPNAAAYRDGRIRLIRGPVQSIEHENQYDFVVSGLPLTAFRLEEVVAVLDVFRRVLRPGGVLSYFEYVALRKLKVWSSASSSTARIKPLSRYLDRQIQAFQTHRQIVWRNVPPAHVRYWQFDSAQQPSID